jgi:uncharacterized protein YpmB
MSKKTILDFKNIIIIGLLVIIITGASYMWYSSYKEKKEKEQKDILLAEYERGKIDGVREGIDSAMRYIYEQANMCQQVPIRIPPNNEPITLIALECLDR